MTYKLYTDGMFSAYPLVSRDGTAGVFLAAAPSAQHPCTIAKQQESYVELLNELQTQSLNVSIYHAQIQVLIIRILADILVGNTWPALRL